MIQIWSHYKSINFEADVSITVWKLNFTKNVWAY